MDLDWMDALGRSLQGFSRTAWGDDRPLSTNKHSTDLRRWRRDHDGRGHALKLPATTAFGGRLRFSLLYNQMVEKTFSV